MRMRGCSLLMDSDATVFVRYGSHITKKCFFAYNKRRNKSFSGSVITRKTNLTHQWASEGNYYNLTTVMEGWKGAGHHHSSYASFSTPVSVDVKDRRCRLVTEASSGQRSRRGVTKAMCSCVTPRRDTYTRHMWLLLCCHGPGWMGKEAWQGGRGTRDSSLLDKTHHVTCPHVQSYRNLNFLECKNCMFAVFATTTPSM